MAASTATKVAGGPLMNSLKRLVFRLTGFNQYGMYHDDVLYENDDVKEALRRLPQDVKDERNFRMNRALLLSMSKTVLPKEEWVSFEEDREKGRYLQKYLNEVIHEKKEKEQWNKQ